MEGFEKEVFSTLKVAIPYINFEANFPEFKSETIDIIKQLNNISNKYLFQLIIDHQSILDDWQNSKDFIKYLEETDMRYLDVYCKIN